MQLQNRAIRSYGSVHAAGSLGSLQGVHLTQMLFDGLLDSLVALEGHVAHRSIDAKSACVSRAQGILVGLQSTLDFERGGDIARNLNDLYLYITRTLVRVHAYNDLQALGEITGIVREIRDAWKLMSRPPSAGRTEPLRS
jgi:flagellar secretion chaperone FliS